MPANLENSAVATEVSFHSNPKKGQQGWNYQTIALVSHASKVILKILQARLQQHVNWERSDVQAGFRKGRGTRDQIANIHWIIEKEIKKKKEICFIDYTKAFDCVDHNKLWKILKEMGIPDHLTCLLRSLYAWQEVTVRTGAAYLNLGHSLFMRAQWFPMGCICCLWQVFLFPLPTAPFC